MSLYKQLWLLITTLMLIAFIGSFSISTITIKNSMERQLHIKNIDNANNLALAASQLASDQTMVELLISAQFDSGHYQRLRFVNPKGETVIDLRQPLNASFLSTWFRGILKIDAGTATAPIQSGWNQLGKIEVQSDPSFAYQSLWSITFNLLLYFTAAAILFGLVGHLVLSYVTRPLHKVVEQSRALIERRFHTLPLPKTLEFRELVMAMNLLSDTVKHFFHQESSQLYQMRLDHQTDNLTKIPSREYFLSMMKQTLKDQKPEDQGSLVILRIHNLQSLNRNEGRRLVDSMLKQIGELLNSLVAVQSNWIAGRLNGSDFAVLAPTELVPGALANQIFQAVTSKLKELDLQEEVIIPTAAHQFHSSDTVPHILSMTDQALILADSRNASCIEVTKSGVSDDIRSPHQWQQLIDDVIENKELLIDSNTVISKSGKFIYSRLGCSHIDGDDFISKRRLKTWVSRLQRGYQFDKVVLEKAIEFSTKLRHPVSFSPSPITLKYYERKSHIPNEFSHTFPPGTYIEIPEYFASQNFSEFKRICYHLNEKGFRVGLTQAGLHLENISSIYDCGISFIALDSSITMEIESSNRNQVLVRCLAIMFHSVGTKVYATEIRSPQHWELLVKLGIDGGSGPYVEIRTSKTQ